jgi:hypothetical protein
MTAADFIRAVKLGIIGGVVGGLSAGIAVALYGGDFVRDVSAAVLTGFVAAWVTEVLTHALGLEDGA